MLESGTLGNIGTPRGEGQRRQQQRPQRPEGLRIGYAAGAFDLFHVGHLNLLRQAKLHCDYLIAGVVSDEMLRENKGIDPVIPTLERCEIVENIRFVDEIYVERVPDKLDAWSDVGFTHFFKGDDWRGTDRGRALERRFAKVGVEVVYFPYTAHTSSTVLRRALDALERGPSRRDSIKGNA